MRDELRHDSEVEQADFGVEQCGECAGAEPCPSAVAAAFGSALASLVWAALVGVVLAAVLEDSA